MTSLAVGSPEHRHLLSRFFIESYVAYEPETIAWPDLAGEDRARLVSLPFWGEAVSTEAVTSRTVQAAASLEDDPDLRAAIALQGEEEGRHARLLAVLTRHYGIKVTQPPVLAPSADLERDFLFAGFGECFDSFFAFGLFALAAESGFFSKDLISIFEPVVQEEARHILFFVNWVRYRRSRLACWRRPLFSLRCWGLILRQVWSRIQTARRMDGAGADSENFTMTGHKALAESLTLHRLLETCLRENERRLSRYDPRLLRPRLVPGIARALHRILPATI